MSNILENNGKAMAITLSDAEVSDHEFGSDEDAFTATTI